jgi:hypothetical protein
LKSYRRERTKELRGDLKKKHVAAGKVVQAAVRFKTPIGTPESTGNPNYKVTAALWRSIEYDPHDDYVDIKTAKSYAAFVHNGTYSYNRGRGPWTEAEAREFDSLRDTGDGPGVGQKGMRPRAFLVNGLLESRPALQAIYRKPMN